MRDHVVAEKRVQIRGPDATDAVNVNPLLSGIAVNGKALLDSQILAVGDLYLTPLLSSAPRNVAQQYTEYDAAAVPLATKTEEWVYAWFSTAGKIEDMHTRAAATPDKWTVDAGAGRALAAVLRDLRGGVDWLVRQVGIAPLIVVRPY